MKPAIITVTLITFLLIAAALVITYYATPQANNVIAGSNVMLVDGMQIITLRAKGGYAPRSSIAKPNMPTILRLETRGTFDCSSSVRIPSMDITRNLPPSGTTDIALGIPQAGTLLGSCGMGMYPFEINFQN